MTNGSLIFKYVFHSCMFILTCCLVIVVGIAYELHVTEKNSIELFDYYMSNSSMFKNVTVNIISNENETFCGKYITDRQLIIINNRSNCNNRIGTLYHEYGHHIYYYIITDEQRTEYCQIFNNSDVVVSEYALMGGGCREDFAESYMYFQLDTKPLDFSREQFFRKLIEDYNYRIV